MVLEVLSPATRSFDLQDQLEEYKSVASLEYIILVDADAPQIRVYHRLPPETWLSDRLTGLDAILRLPRLGVEIPLADLYTGLAFRARPTLVADAAIKP